jgi:hypothetical protein
LHESIVDALRNEYEQKLKLKKDEIIENCEKEKQQLIESERQKYNEKLILAKNEIKMEYNQLLKVFISTLD